MVTVTCSTSGSPPLNGRWTKNGRVWDTSVLTFNQIHRRDAGSYKFIVNNGHECKEAQKEIPLSVYYLDDLEVIGSSNKSYSQSNPVVLFNLSVNAYPNNSSLSCKSSAPNILTSITSHDAGPYTKQYLVFVYIKSTVDSGSIVCKAEHSAGVRERKLHFYKRPMLFETIGGQFKITNQEWKHELKDPKTAEYQDTENKCIKIFENAYSGLPYLVGVDIKKFLKGSIIVRFELGIVGEVPDPLLPLRDYVKGHGGNMDGLQIAYNSIQKSSDNLPTASAGESKTTTVAVLGILFALSIVLNIIFIAVFLWLRRKDSKRNYGKRSNKRDEVGRMNDISLQETSLNATDNDTPNVPEYEPIGRRGLAASTSGIPEYEAVTTRTQQAQPQSGVHTNNPMPQYESADRHRLPGVDSNPPSATYQTIQPRTGDYRPLSPSTRLPPRGAVLESTGSPTRTGEYQSLQHKGVSPQYQSLDDLSRC